MPTHVQSVVLGFVLLTGFLFAQNENAVPGKKYYAIERHENGSSIIRVGAESSPLMPYVPLARTVNPSVLRQRSERLNKSSQPPPRLTMSSASVIFTVTDPGDEPDSDLSDDIFSPATFRSAIQNANKTESLDFIVFASGVNTIMLTSQLPHIFNPVSINGGNGAQRTVIDGSLSAGTALMTVLQDSEIFGLVFKNSAGRGLGLTVGGGNNAIYNCVFENNKGAGLNVNSDNNIIGWSTEGYRNYFIANKYNTVTFASAYGIAIVFGNWNQIYGNYVGTMDGTTAQPNESGGIYVDGNYNHISGNLVSGNYWSGLDLDGFASRVETNVIGLNISWTAPLPNGSAGIYSVSSGDTMSANIIAGNYGQGISIGSEFSVDVLIKDNYVGCDDVKMFLAGNGGTGISTRGPRTKILNNTVVQNWIGIELLYKADGCIVQNNSIGVINNHPQWTGNLHEGLIISSKNNRIGGSPDSANIVGENGWTGILMIGGTIFSFGGQTPNIVSGNVISFNSIGISTTRVKSPNKYGVEIMGYIQDNLILENEILSHTAHGIVFRKFGNGLPSGNTVRRNYIGSDRMGFAVYGNDSAGIYIENARNNMIGGPNDSDRNVIRHNKGGGIVAAGGKGISFLGNIIYHNIGLGIDLGKDGPTLADSLDMDDGPNGLTNPPILQWYGWDESTYIIKGVMHAKPLSEYRLEFFKNFLPDSSGFGEGTYVLGSMTVTTDASGNTPFHFTYMDDAPPYHISATATGPDSSTSEFAKAPLVVNSTADRPDADPNDGVPWTNGPTVFGMPEVTLRSAIQASNHIQGYDWITFNIPFTGTQIISPSSEYEMMIQQVSIDGSFQPGYIAPEPLIVVSGAIAGDDADGLLFSAGGSSVRGLNIHSFHRYGIYNGFQTMKITDCIVTANRKGGAFSAGSFLLEGTNRFNANGRVGGVCQDSTAFGILAEVDITGSGTVEANGNCANGISNGMFGDLFAFFGTVTSNGNGGSGLHGNKGIQLYDGPVEANGNGWYGIGAVSGNIIFNSIATRTGTENHTAAFTLIVNDNRHGGIIASYGDIFLTAPAQVNGNRAGKADQQAIDEANTGIWAFGYVEVNGLEAKNNGLNGIGAKNIKLKGSGTVAQHISAGVHAWEDIETEPGDWLFEQNGIHGVYAGGSFNAQGMTRAKNNGWYVGPETPPSISTGAIHAEEYVAVDYLVANGNENRSGVYAGKGVWVRGTAEVRSNDYSGILSGAYIQIDYGPSNITGNGSWGLAAPFGQVIAYEPLFVLSNGLKGCGTSLPSEAGGIGAASISLTDATILGNCGPGVWAFHSLNIGGTALIDSNLGSGILSRGSVAIAGGRISANKQWGIVAPVLRLGPVSIASNDEGGILGEPASLYGGARFAKISSNTNMMLASGGSSINGGQVINNGGEGIKYKFHLPLNVTHANITGNAGSGISALAPGTVTANGNWWGSPTGPGGMISGAVTASSWRSIPVGVSVRPHADTVFLRTDHDTLSLSAANWSETSDSLVVTFHQTTDWIPGPESLTVSVQNNHARSFIVPLTVSGPGNANTMTIRARSSIDPARRDSAVVALIRYTPTLTRIVVVYDTVTMQPGDSVKFGAIGLDQAGYSVPIEPMWSAGGGQINNQGWYKTGQDTGTFTVTATDSATGISGNAVVRIKKSLSGNAENGITPESFSLEQNYPNPFNASTTIRFAVPSASRISIGIYNVLGQRVAELTNGIFSAGWHEIRWSPEVSSGLYFYRIEAAEISGTAVRFGAMRKMILLK